MKKGILVLLFLIVLSDAFCQIDLSGAWYIDNDVNHCVQLKKEGQDYLLMSDCNGDVFLSSGKYEYQGNNKYKFYKYTFKINDANHIQFIEGNYSIWTRGKKTNSSSSNNSQSNSSNVQYDISGEWRQSINYINAANPKFVFLKQGDNYLIKNLGDANFDPNKIFKPINGGGYKASWSDLSFTIIDANHIRFIGFGKNGDYERIIHIKELEDPYKVTSNGTVTGSQGLDNLLGAIGSVASSNSSSSSSSSSNNNEKQEQINKCITETQNGITVKRTSDNMDAHCPCTYYGWTGTLSSQDEFIKSKNGEWQMDIWNHVDDGIWYKSQYEVIKAYCEYKYK